LLKTLQPTTTQSVEIANTPVIGATPAITSYKANVVKMYKKTYSIARSQNKNVFLIVKTQAL
jgi:hypothetical protein